MPAVYSTTFKNALLNSMLRFTLTEPLIGGYALCGGTQPVGPGTPLTIGNWFNSTVQRVNNLYLPATSGVAVLSTNITVTNGSGGALVPTFIRLYPYSAIGQSPASAVGYVDLPVGLTGSGSPCILSSLAPVAAAGTVQITNMSIKANMASNTLKLSDALASSVVNYSMLGNRGSASIYGQALGYSAASGPYPLLMCYSGSVPASADALATGSVQAPMFDSSSTEIWSTALAGGAALTGGRTIFRNSLTGTITYFRLSRAGVSGTSYPTATMQGTVGLGGSGADMILNDTTTASSTPQILSLNISL